MSCATWLALVPDDVTVDVGELVALLSVWRSLDVIEVVVVVGLVTLPF